MTDPIRAALERLVELDEGCTVDHWHAAILAASAALEAAPADGEGPSDDQLDLVVIAIQALAPHQPDATTHDLHAVDRGREILRQSLARWGRPATPPTPAAGEVGFFRRLLAVGGCAGGFKLSPDQCQRLAALLEQLSATPPTPAAGEVGAAIRRLWEMATDMEPGSSDRWTIENAVFLLEQLSATPPTPQPVAVSDERRLHGKYIIHRARDGAPVDYPCFVLRLDGSDPAAMAAIRAYAEDPACPPELAGDLSDWIAQLRPTTPPAPAAGEVEEVVAWLREQATWFAADDPGHESYDRAAALLEQLSAAPPAPQPVAVSERLPGAEDCDAEGRCWWWYSPVPEQTYGYWAQEDDATDRSYEEWPSAWLPAHALPIPATTPAGQEGK